VLLPESDLASLGDHIERLRTDDDARHQLGLRAARAGDQHRGGSLVELVERVAREGRDARSGGGRAS
jgi:hypothetical protein